MKHICITWNGDNFPKPKDVIVTYFLYLHNCRIIEQLKFFKMYIENIYISDIPLENKIHEDDFINSDQYKHIKANSIKLY